MNQLIILLLLLLTSCANGYHSNKDGQWHSLDKPITAYYIAINKPLQSKPMSLKPKSVKKLKAPIKAPISKADSCRNMLNKGEL